MFMHQTITLLYSSLSLLINRIRPFLVLLMIVKDWYRVWRAHPTEPLQSITLINLTTFPYAAQEEEEAWERPCLTGNHILQDTRKTPQSSGQGAGKPWGKFSRLAWDIMQIDCTPASVFKPDTTNDPVVQMNQTPLGNPDAWYPPMLPVIQERNSCLQNCLN